MKISYTYIDSNGLGYPYLIEGSKEDLQPLINYLNTIQIYKQEDEPFSANYLDTDSGFYICTKELINLQENQELLDIELVKS